MLRNVCIAMNRTTLLRYLQKFKNIKEPADFIEEILKVESKISDEKKRVYQIQVQRIFEVH